MGHLIETNKNLYQIFVLHNLHILTTKLIGMKSVVSCLHCIFRQPTYIAYAYVYTKLPQSYTLANFIVGMCCFSLTYWRLHQTGCHYYTSCEYKTTSLTRHRSNFLYFPHRRQLSHIPKIWQLDYFSLLSTSRHLLRMWRRLKNLRN